MKAIERRAREQHQDRASGAVRGDLMARRPFVWAFVATAGVLVALGIAAALLSLSGVAFSVFAAIFITLGLDPLVRWFQRRGMKRGYAILTVIILFVLVIAGMLWLVLPLVIEQSAAFIRSLPQLYANLQDQAWFQEASSGSGGVLGTIYSWFIGIVTDPNTWATLGGGALNIGIAILGGISTGFFVFVLTIYFTATLDASKAAVYTLIAASHRARFVDYAERIMQNVGRYLSGMVVLAFFNAVYSLILLTLVGQPFALVISVAAFFITLIPLIGTVLTTAVMTALTLFVSPTAALVVLIAMLVYMQVEAYILTPRVMSKAVQVPGSIVLIAALAGGTLAGLPGALVAIPVAAGILLILKEVVVPWKART
ncbi:AI-2E family transporter [Agromyces aurantiacus]|uniref:AI-2E family transporter n=1 Tax=Agromyces aurantiacus TaxID=165814 RepID=A0ABV9R3L7_9MICO|nr:AI-2E family transporter [Agromyces aurantiacus]MBM7503098.1 putative PurR-regulated permease PerM [Agromyces aurantiacus]